MVNQIRPDDHNASDWFWTKLAERGIGIIFYSPRTTVALKKLLGSFSIDNGNGNNNATT